MFPAHRFQWSPRALGNALTEERCYVWRPRNGSLRSLFLLSIPLACTKTSLATGGKRPQAGEAGGLALPDSFQDFMNQAVELVGSSGTAHFRRPGDAFRQISFLHTRFHPRHPATTTTGTQVDSRSLTVFRYRDFGR